MITEADNFEVAEISQRLQYYSYVRQFMEAKEISYWVGNPSVYIINGSFFLKSIAIQEGENYESYQQYLIKYKTAYLQFNQRQFTKTLLLVGIPNSKNPLEVCERLSLSVHINNLLEIKVIKTNHFKYYGMLLLFSSQKYAEKFYEQYFAEQYNSLEIERILIREVYQFSYFHTEAVKSQNCTQQMYQQRKKSHVQFQETLQKIPQQEIFQKFHSFSNNFANSPKKGKKAQNQQSSDFLSCAICFEQSGGIYISILCSHYFHIKCLQQWTENTCPLCRYHQHPPIIKFCQKCNECEGLWVCLVCGVRLCCGVEHDILGGDSHIYQHYLETEHRLSMDVETKFIFDAKEPAFLHQMLYRQVLKNENAGTITESKGKKGKRSKMGQKISQYQQNISQQMQKQRLYFEENISKQVKLRKERIKQKKKKVQKLQQQQRQLSKELENLQKTRVEQEIKVAKLEKELKVINDVQIYWRKIIEKNKEEDCQRKIEQEKQIKKLDEKIFMKREEIKDYKKNLELKTKLHTSIGNQKVQNTILLSAPFKDSKKKKK